MRNRTKNKLTGISLIGLGALTIFVESDLTFFIFSLVIGIPIFLSRD